jgi:hypothetical protein
MEEVEQWGRRRDMKRGWKKGKKLLGTKKGLSLTSTSQGRSIPLKKERTRSQKSLKKELDAVFSQYIRLKDAVDGIATCVTCGVKKPWKEMQAGHYISRKHLSTRWDEVNVHCQCVGCNIFKKGAMDEYARFMIKKYGQGVLDDLAEKKNTIVKGMDYERLIEDYRRELCLVGTT